MPRCAAASLVTSERHNLMTGATGVEQTYALTSLARGQATPGQLAAMVSN